MVFMVLWAAVYTMAWQKGSINVSVINEDNVCILYSWVESSAQNFPVKTRRGKEEQESEIALVYLISLMPCILQGQPFPWNKSSLFPSGAGCHFLNPQFPSEWGYIIMALYSGANGEQKCSHFWRKWRRRKPPLTKTGPTATSMASLSPALSLPNCSYLFCHLQMRCWNWGKAFGLVRFPAFVSETCSRILERAGMEYYWYRAQKQRWSFCGACGGSNYGCQGQL